MGAASHGHRNGRWRPNRRIVCPSLSLFFIVVLACVTFPRAGYSAPSRLIEDLRFHSAHDATRVVIELNGPITYTVGRLRKPARLFVDLPKTRLPADWERRSVRVADGRLQSIRIATNRPGVVRVVLDLYAQQNHHILTLKDPYRLVIDLQAQRDAAAPPKHTRKTPAPPPTIVIDPGHGGKDPGALGPGGIREKTVVLRIAKALRDVIRKELPSYRVILTRERDVFIPLGQRARIANKQGAHVFISIHANASKNRQARGIETWYLSFSANERAQRRAARENNMSTKELSDLQRILLDLRQTDRINQSAILAGLTQAALVKRVKAHYKRVPGRGVEGAPFVVLLNTAMPSILVEVAFVSNKRDARLLRKQSYQRALAEGIFTGIRKYLQEAKMVRAQ